MMYKYRIEIVANVHMTSIGKDRVMNAVELEAFRKELNRSFLPGGVNGVSDGMVVPYVSTMTMIRQSDSLVMAGTSAPMFEVI